MILPATGPAIIIALPDNVLALTTVDTRLTTSSVAFREELLKTDSDIAVGCELDIVGNLHENDHV